MGMNPKDRLAWAKDLPFSVKVVGVDVRDLDEVEWLFWVGCAGEDRAGPVLLKDTDAIIKVSASCVCGSTCGPITASTHQPTDPDGPRIRWRGPANR